MAVSFTRLGARAPLSLLPGAFQSGGHVHHGSLLVSPGGLYDWPASNAALDEAGILSFLDEEQDNRGDFLLLGTGKQPVLPSATLRHEAEQRGLGLEFMDTRAACRTYNILIAENRFFCAALVLF